MNTNTKNQAENLIIDVLGKPCPIPVIEAKKALAQDQVDSVTVKVDNIVAVQNLEKMAKGYAHAFSYSEKAKNNYEVCITKTADSAGQKATEHEISIQDCNCSPDHEPLVKGPTVVITSKCMGAGSDELGAILIKGFIYSLSELNPPPEALLFLNSGALLTAEGANTIPDIKKLEQKGCQIFTCGTCSNFFGLQDKLAVGKIIDMYGITEKMTSAGKNSSQLIVM